MTLSVFREKLTSTVSLQPIGPDAARWYGRVCKSCRIQARHIKSLLGVLGNCRYGELFVLCNYLWGRSVVRNGPDHLNRASQPVRECKGTGSRIFYIMPVKYAVCQQACSPDTAYIAAADRRLFSSSALASACCPLDSLGVLPGLLQSCLPSNPSQSSR